MFSISRFKGAYTKTKGGQNEHYASFLLLSKQFKRPKKGEKETEYWTRGETKNGDRSDKNIEMSRLVIIEANESRKGLSPPHPKDAHQKLVDLGINHFIYTTYNNKPNQMNRYKIVIECDPHPRELFYENVLMVMQMTELDIRVVKSDYVWCGGNYFPYRKNPYDKKFCFFSFVTGHPLTNSKHRRDFEEDDLTMDNPLAFKIDMPEQFVKKDIVIPVAPGRLGRLVQEAHDYMRYPDKIIAMVTALFTVASVVGRRFNVDFSDKSGFTDPTGLNLYLTLVGSTGVGKDQMKSFAEKILYSTNQNDKRRVNSFLSGGDFTSTKAIYNQIRFARSQGVILSEAGINLQNNVGDKQSVKQFLLSCYGRSHWCGMTDPKSYSDADASVEPLQAVALTKLSESTESELFKGYMSNNAIESGLVPRESVFRILKPCTKLNRVKKRHIEQEHIIQFETLCALAGEVQQSEDPKAIIIHCEGDKELINDIYDFGDLMREMMFNDSLDRIEQVMASRMLVKALRFAGIASVYNANNEDEFILKPEHWLFGKKLAIYEMDMIRDCFSDYTTTDIDGVAQELAREICKVLCGLGVADYDMTKQLRNEKSVPLHKLRKIFKKRKPYIQYEKQVTFNNTRLLNKDHFGDIVSYLVRDVRVLDYKEVCLSTSRRNRKTTCLSANESINDYVKTI